MSTTTKKRSTIMARELAGRCYWDVDRWIEYGACLHRAIGHLAHAGCRLPPTPGWKARDTDALLRARGSIEIALVKMERVILEHFGGRWEDVPAPVARFPQHWFEHPDVQPRPWTRRPEPTSREDWMRFGDMVKEARETLQQCYVVFSNQCRGRDRKPHLAALNKAIAQIDKAKCRLDSLVCNQHPDWPEASRIFYGPREAMHHS
jgi:hypothetical protein